MKGLLIAYQLVRPIEHLKEYWCSDDLQRDDTNLQCHFIHIDCAAIKSRIPE
jgi:hypothetical protein